MAGSDRRKIAARPRSVRIRLGVWCAVVLTLFLALGVGAVAIIQEANTSALQARHFAPRAAKLGYEIRPGRNADIALLKGGPYDLRLGYSRLPEMLRRLTKDEFVVIRQAKFSPALRDFVRHYGYAVYDEKFAAGLSLRDRDGTLLYRAMHPERTFAGFENIPSLVVETLLFIEDRALLEAEPREKNPAVNWKRFALAGIGHVAGEIHPALRQGGASTLATQIEKFRHSPGGRTRSVGDKIRQMLAAAYRSYLDGPDTTAARRRIVTTYLNATPLSARPGYGEVIGLGDGLWAWYGTSFDEMTRLLGSEPSTDLPRQAQIYKQVLSLILAQRRPSYYLINGRRELEAMADHHLNLLAEAKVITPELRDAALRAPLRLTQDAPQPKPRSFASRKATGAIRTELLARLGVPSLYALDRLDLNADTTLESRIQDEVNDVLVSLGSRKETQARGLNAANMLGGADPAPVIYSIVLHERGEGKNYVRLHADNLEEPFDVNSGAKLILGSTAKLRTLATYLDIIDRLHGRLSKIPERRLRRLAAEAPDGLARWAAEYLAVSSDDALRPMLQAAMQRRYSADPGEEFFTGGGVHTFHNFNAADDDKMPTVEEALTRSVNLPFIRLMRDIRDYYIGEADGAAILREEAGAPQRNEYLKRFADIEGTTYIDRFRKQFGARSRDEILSLMAEKARGMPQRLAIVFRSLRPRGSRGELLRFLNRHAPSAAIGREAADALYQEHVPHALSLNDRAYLLGVHPLQLWLAQYLQQHPGAPRPAVLHASADARQHAYAWLMKTSRAGAQNSRIRILIEKDAFARIHDDWKRQGYPFGFLVPSLATAIGSSGDRPDALAELMGIILNHGVRQPTIRVERLHFAAGTPYETELSAAPAAPERVFAPEVAEVLREALGKVVEEGTGRRIAGVFRNSAGQLLHVGGKTGTGDNRHKTYRGGRLVSSRPVDRTATFVFFIGDAFYGAVTAHVAGPKAAGYRFTSALATQLLKSLAPHLMPLFKNAEPAAYAGTPGVSAFGTAQLTGATLLDPDRIPAAALQEQLDAIYPPAGADTDIADTSPLAVSVAASPDPSTPSGRTRLMIGKPSPIAARSERDVTAELNRLSAAGGFVAAQPRR